MTTLMPVLRRKCRNPECGKVSLVTFAADNCPKCGTPYGRIDLGFDAEVPVEMKSRR